MIEQQLIIMKVREKELLEEKAGLEREKKKLFQGAENKIAAAEQKARAIVDGARRQAELLQTELKDLREQMNKAQYHELKSGVKRAAGKLQDVEVRQRKNDTTEHAALTQAPQVGQTVFLPTLNRNVTVESIQGNQAFVTADSLRMKVNWQIFVHRWKKRRPWFVFREHSLIVL